MRRRERKNYLTSMENDIYQIDDVVEVVMPDGLLIGKVVDKARVLLSGERTYIIHGKGFVTECSARSITRKVEQQSSLF